jgi:pyridoxal phosphate enzyme (YggS family)
MSSIAENILAVRERIAAAAARAGRADSAVELLAVSKTFSADVVREAARTPHDLFGESRVQEAVTKIPQCPSHLRWHFVGHLQKNKVRKILPLVEAVESVDSLELALDLERVAADCGRRPDIFLQINIAEDAAKFGFTASSVREALGTLLELERVSVVGLMTIPPLVRDAEDNRRHFAALRELRDALENEGGVQLPQLSMGMSDDYEIAVEEGATLVRVGSAIFGRRRNLFAKPADD